MNKDDHKHLDTAIDLLNAQALNFGHRFIKDGKVRVRYRMQVEKYGEQIRYDVESGKLSAEQGAKQANAMRNNIMKASRIKSSDLGRAISKAYKKQGLTVPDLENKYAYETYANEFNQLELTQKKEVWKSIIDASMRTNHDFDTVNYTFSYLGRALIVTSIGVATYKIITAKNKVKETEKQAVNLSSAYVGAEIGGTAGAFFGPFDVVTVPLGIFVGGILGSLFGQRVSSKI